MITDEQALTWVKNKMTLEIEEEQARLAKEQKEQAIIEKTKELARIYIPLREQAKSEEERKKIAYEQNEKLSQEIAKL